MEVAAGQHCSFARHIQCRILQRGQRRTGVKLHIKTYPVFVQPQCHQNVVDRDLRLQRPTSFLQNAVNDDMKEFRNLLIRERNTGLDLHLGLTQRQVPAKRADRHRETQIVQT